MLTNSGTMYRNPTGTTWYYKVSPLVSVISNMSLFPEVYLYVRTGLHSLPFHHFQLCQCRVSDLFFQRLLKSDFGPHTYPSTTHF